ncbi:hypothetical protein CsSME_00031294 [Camellia sinensis var. sinensis]
MDAIDELAQLADSMRQASALLANEYVDENSSSSRRASTFLNVIALGNTLGPGILGNILDGIQMLGKCEQVNDLRCNLNIINAAARETILTIGNELNQGTA